MTGDTTHLMYGELPLIDSADGSKQIAGYPVKIIRPAKTAVVRLPTTEEMMTYMAAQRSLHRDLGRRKSEGQSVPNPESNLTLFKAIRLDKPA